jgi:LysM repeat protein
VSVDELKTWNNLQSNELSIGQTLFVAAPERDAVTRSEERNAVVRSEEPKQSTPTPQAQTRREPVTTAETPAPVRSAPSSKTTAPSSPSGQSAESIRISESLKNGDEIVEGGLAELIEGTEGNRKYLALHRTAPMGTILKVRNEMNNREVFVRVMGKLPDTAMTDKLIIKISKSAYDRLGAIDPRFRVEVTYYK